MSLNIQSYYGYDQAKLGYIKGDKSNMAACHAHKDPYAAMRINSPISDEHVRKLFDVAFFGNRVVPKIEDVSTGDLKAWSALLKDCIHAMDDDFQSKSDRGDENYRKAREYGCTDDAIALDQIDAELIRRDRTKCDQLAKRITQLEAENKELAEKVDVLSKKKKCCSLFW